MLGDVGALRKADKNTTKNVCTVKYMSPENLNNLKIDFSHITDVWSMGCILYQIWEYDVPWTDADFEPANEEELIKLYKAIYLAILKERTPNGKNKPLKFDKLKNDKLKTLIESMLSIDPSERPTAEISSKNANNLSRILQVIMRKGIYK